ncbi:MAG: hypothetical protein AAF467_23210 [Actinomycetota bacterium]
MVSSRRVPEPYSFPELTFKIWDYRVSLAQMVIRSPGEDWDGPHLDLHFSGVEYIRTPTLIRGLRVVAATEGERDEAMVSVGADRFDPSHVWILESGSSRHLIVASGLEVAETDYPMMSTALIRPNIDQ